MGKKLLHDERIDFGDNEIHVVSESANDFEVWLNTPIADFDGLCIGCGETREQAVKDAAIALEQASKALRAAMV